MMMLAYSLLYSQTGKYEYKVFLRNFEQGITEDFYTCGNNCFNLYDIFYILLRYAAIGEISQATEKDIRHLLGIVSEIEDNLAVVYINICSGSKKICSYYNSLENRENYYGFILDDRYICSIIDCNSPSEYSSFFILNRFLSDYITEIGNIMIMPCLKEKYCRVSEILAGKAIFLPVEADKDINYHFSRNVSYNFGKYIVIYDGISPTSQVGFFSLIYPDGRKEIFIFNSEEKKEKQYIFNNVTVKKTAISGISPERANISVRFSDTIHYQDFIKSWYNMCRNSKKVITVSPTVIILNITIPALSEEGDDNTTDTGDMSGIYPDIYLKPTEIIKPTITPLPTITPQYLLL